MHNWDDFRYFLAVVEQGSYSAAAKHLGVNHSTVSRRIQTLESKHGVRLFDRLQDGYRMTDAGGSVYELIQQMESTSHKASRILLGQDQRLEGEIKLTMPHDIFDKILAKPLRTFNHQHPQIRLNMLVSQGLRNMANREADLAVRVTANPPDYLIGTRVTYIQHGFYVNRHIDLKESTPLVLWKGLAELPDWALEHFPNPYIAMHVDNLMSMYRAVKEGFGVARMPCFLPDVIGDDEVPRLPIAVPRSHWGIWILNHADLRSNCRINACRQFLKAELNKNIPLFQGEFSR